MPDRPPEMSENWAQITVTRCINGHKTTVNLLGDGLNWSTYSVWNPATQEQRGNMTIRKMLLDILQYFPKVRSG